MSIYTSMRSLIVKTPILKDIWYRASYAAKQQRRSEKHDLIHYDDYRALHPECFKMLMGDSQTDVCEVHYAGEAKPKSKPADMPAIWQIEVNNATLIGESNAFIDSEGIAVFNHCYGSNVDYTDPAIMNGHVHTKLGKKHRVNYYSRGGYNIPLGISMLHTYCWNYFHFVLEALPKFQLIEKSGLPADIPLIFDSIVKNTPQFMELIDIFNTENREIIFIDKLHWHKVGRLYLFTPVQVFPLNFANINATTLSDMLYHKESIDFIKQRIADAAAKEPEQKKSYPEKIFLSRKNTTRRPYNDAEVEQSLQPFGYSTILTGGMSVKEQCRLFSSVTKIVAPSGAALTNIIFCAPGTHVLVLYSIRKLTSTFSTLAAVLGLDMEFFIGKPENLNDIHTAFTIDTDSLQKYLSHVRDFS